MRTKILVWLMIVGLMLGVTPTNIWAETTEQMADEEMVAVTEVVWYKGEPLNGVRIEIALVDKIGDIGEPFAMSDTGTLTYTVNKEKYTGKWVYIKRILPEGYMPYWCSDTNIIEGWESVDELRTIESGIGVYNTALDGVLSANISSITASVGDVIDLSGAINMDNTDFQLYYTAPGGEQERVVCDWYSEEGPSPCDNDGNGKLTVTGARRFNILFEYNRLACFVLPITVLSQEIEPDGAEDSEKKFIYHYEVTHHGVPVEGTEIIVTLGSWVGEAIKSDEVLAVSQSGAVDVWIDREAYAGKVLLIDYILPEGYVNEASMSAGIGNPVSTVSSIDLLVQWELEQWETQVTKPSEDGTLTANIDSLVLNIGEGFDFGGAYDLAKTDFQLFQIKPDGTRNRVIGDYHNVDEWYDEESFYSYDTEGNFTGLRARKTEITFYYDGMWYKLPIEIVDPKSSAVEEKPVSNTGSVSDTGIDTGTVSNGNTPVTGMVNVEAKPTEWESSFTAQTGELMRQIATAEDSRVAVVGKSGLIPIGGKFESKRVTEGEVFTKAAEAIGKVIEDCKMFQVFEIKLKDAAGMEIHQMNGYVNVTLPIPAGMTLRAGKTLAVYRMDEDGSLVECNTYVKDGMITFATDHFSTYIIAEKDRIAAPKTGDMTNEPAVWMALSGMLLCMAAMLMKKHDRKAKK